MVWSSLKRKSACAGRFVVTLFSPYQNFEPGLSPSSAGYPQLECSVYRQNWHALQSRKKTTTISSRLKAHLYPSLLMLLCGCAWKWGIPPLYSDSSWGTWVGCTVNPHSWILGQSLVSTENVRSSSKSAQIRKTTYWWYQILISSKKKTPDISTHSLMIYVYHNFNHMVFMIVGWYLTMFNHY
jgi:hypothetical protein